MTTLQEEYEALENSFDPEKASEEHIRCMNLLRLTFPLMKKAHKVLVRLEPNVIAPYRAYDELITDADPNRQLPEPPIDG